MEGRTVLFPFQKFGRNGTGFRALLNVTLFFILLREDPLVYVKLYLSFVLDFFFCEKRIDKMSFYQLRRVYCLINLLPSLLNKRSPTSCKGHAEKANIFCNHATL